MNPEVNLRLMQIVMKYLPEGKSWLRQKGVNVTMADIQPMMGLAVKILNEAYELGKKNAR
ncbi:ComZ family protein [Fictibacillus sp. Mic-4]|uniref:ComZ family protein n=1 Tax=Fictibacillus TaxID=1329200 RepID=UPI00040CEFB6|nr:ComZ family protein [Fictibacillus gelatini]